MDLTQTQEYELLATISARGEIPVKFIYLNEGAAKWDTYYRKTEHGGRDTLEEDSLMSAHIDSFMQSFHDVTGLNLIDLGCGNGLPALKIMKQLTGKGLSIHYVPVDISQTMLTLAAKNIKKQFPDLSVTEMQVDFENESLTSKLLGMKQTSRQPNLLINLGGTLGNYVNVGAVLTNFLQSMTLEDYLIVGNGLVNDQNPQKILSNYIGKESVKYEDTRVARKLGLFNDQDDYKVLWNAVQHRVEGRIKLNEDKQLHLAEQSVTMEKDDEILILQSCKYTEVSLTKLLSNVGFRTELLTTNRSRSYVLAMIQPTRYSAS